MNVTILSIAAVIVAAAVIPLFIMGKRKSEKKKKMLLKLDEIAESCNGQISQNEVFGDMAIGLDNKAAMLYFIDQGTEPAISWAENLANFSSCKLINEMRNTGPGTPVVTDKIYLKLTPVSTDSKILKIELYNSDVDAQLAGELQLAEKWNTIINAIIKK